MNKFLVGIGGLFIVIALLFFVFVDTEGRLAYDVEQGILFQIPSEGIEAYFIEQLDQEATMTTFVAENDSLLSVTLSRSDDPTQEGADAFIDARTEIGLSAFDAPDESMKVAKMIGEKELTCYIGTQNGHYSTFCIGQVEEDEIVLTIQVGTSDALDSVMDSMLFIPTQDQIDAAVAIPEGTILDLL